MGQAMLKSIKTTVRHKVKDILNQFPDTRNDDRLLCVTYWREVDKVTTLDGVKGATSPEAIRRARQWLNERGFLLATDPEVLRRRRQSSHEMKGITNI